MQTIEPEHDWQRQLGPWALREYNCLCPLTEQQAERAATWSEAWAAKWKSHKVSREGWPPPKVQATEREGELAIMFVKRQLGESLEEFIETGERPYSVSSMGGGTFHDPEDPLVGLHLEYNGRGIAAYRPTEEEKAWDREWHGFWRPRHHEHHNPGHQAYAPMPREFGSFCPEGRWEIKWGQIRSMLQAERDAARQAEIQPSLF